MRTISLSPLRLAFFLLLAGKATCYIFDSAKICGRPTTRIFSIEAGSSLFRHQDGFDAVVRQRHSCKRFRRYDRNYEDRSKSSTSDPDVIQKAVHCLDLARRTPTAFNTQPYKVVLVHSPEQKQALSKYCIGPNSARILDSDCTAIFLADRQVLRTLKRFRRFLDETCKPGRAPLTWFRSLEMHFYIALFSSGWPLPRLLAAPATFLIRTLMSFANLFTSFFYPLPSLASAETWSSKQAIMVALIYMLGCTSLGLATIPMEGFNASGIRRVIRAPSRYAVPLIVSTGYPHDQKEGVEPTSHERYPMEEMVYGNTFGTAV